MAAIVYRFSLELTVSGTRARCHDAHQRTLALVQRLKALGLHVDHAAGVKQGPVPDAPEVPKTAAHGRPRTAKQKEVRHDDRNSQHTKPHQRRQARRRSP